MSKTQTRIFNPYRSDGRLPNELKNVSVRFFRKSFSNSVELFYISGETKVFCSVVGATSGENTDDFYNEDVQKPENGKLGIFVVYYDYKRSSDSLDNEARLISKIFYNNILKTAIQNTNLHVVVKVLENDGSAFESAINGLSICFLLRCIPMKSIITAINVSKINEKFCVDLNEDEEISKKTEKAIFVFNTQQNIIFCETQNILLKDIWSFKKEGLEGAIKLAKSIKVIIESFNK